MSGRRQFEAYEIVPRGMVRKALEAGFIAGVLVSMIGVLVSINIAKWLT